MYVTKRNGEKEPVQFDKITARCARLCTGLSSLVDPVLVAQKVVQGVYAGVSTRELDDLAAETAAYSTLLHPDYAVLGGRIAVTRLHKETPNRFSDAMELLYGEGVLSEEFMEAVRSYQDTWNAAVKSEQDLVFDYFGFKTLERSYLLRTTSGGTIVERPQYMFMRVAIAIHGPLISSSRADRVPDALTFYTLMSQRFYTHATPTLFNAGCRRPQMSSCFLLQMREDSIEGIYDTLKQCALISKHAGGIGLAVHNIRATGAAIKGTNGTSNGLVPMLRVFDATARYVDQGGGKRKGSIAIYLEPWHADIEEFLELRKNTGAEEKRARDLFYALWISDLFMARVESDGEWTLFCPSEAPGLQYLWGAAFEAKYKQYEADGLGRKRIKARALWFRILESQVETGTPYLLYKDAANAKSNQQHCGTIQSSNLCTEILEYTSIDEVAVCNLASISLPAFVEEGTAGGARTFNFKRLEHITAQVTRALNLVIDHNYYPLEEARRSNMRHRPIGIGVQGLADVFCKLRLPYESPEAATLNREIFETIYYGAVTASVELAAEQGVYDSFKGSPASEGRLQFDLWGVSPSPSHSSGRDWVELKRRLAISGMRNSLLVAPMPTASTSQILGNNESFEPYTSNVFSRRVLSGEFMVVNRHMATDLIERGLWTPELRNALLKNSGSLQSLDGIPEHLKALYKTVWEIPQKTLIDMAADRGPFICQSQSLNLYVAEPTVSRLSSMHIYAWKRGLKTGQYYLRTRPRADPIQFTVISQPVRFVKGEESDRSECATCSA